MLNWLKNASLKNKLLWANLIIILTVFVAVMVIFGKSMQRQRAAVRNTLEMHVDSAAEKIEEGFYNHYHRIQSYSKNPVLSGSTKESKVFVLNELLSLFPDSELILITDENGKVVASTSIDRDLSPIDVTAVEQLDLSQEKWLIDFKKSKNHQDLEKKIFGSHMMAPMLDPRISKILKKPWYGTPFISAIDDGFGSTTGYIVSFDNITWLKRNFDNLRKKLEQSGLKSTEIVLSNADGLILVESTKDSNKEKPEVLSNIESRVSDLNVFTAKKISGPRFVDAIDWTVSINVAKSELYYDTAFFEKVTYLVFGILLIISTLLTLLLAKGLHSRMTHVLSTISSTAKGNLDFISNLQSTADQLTSCSNLQLEQMESASKQLNNILRHATSNAESAQITVESSRSSSDFSRDGKEKMEDVTDSIGGISSSSKSVIVQAQKVNSQLQEIAKLVDTIEDKTSLINDIVFQTKILSFNASVEAARAGEFGKGFSVVAQEIATLARNSGNASQEISEILKESKSGIHQVIGENEKEIESIVQDTNQSLSEGQQTADLCKSVLEKIFEQTSHVSQLAVEIQKDADIQKEDIRQIEDSIKTLATGSHQIESTAQNTQDIALKINEQSEKLSSALGILSKEIHGSQNSTGQKKAA